MNVSEFAAHYTKGFADVIGRYIMKTRGGGDDRDLPILMVEACLNGEDEEQEFRESLRKRRRLFGKQGDPNTPYPMSSSSTSSENSSGK